MIPKKCKHYKQGKVIYVGFVLIINKAKLYVGFVLKFIKILETTIEKYYYYSNLL
jgi:hypothetical protein